MKVALIGAEIEENLALRYIASSLEAAGHEVDLEDFRNAGQLEEVAARVAAGAPDLVGLSMVFTIRAREFVALAMRLRALGCRAHLTAGGHFAALHARWLLERCPALDSIAQGEGEEAMVELAASLEAPERVEGLTLRSGEGLLETGRRRNLDDLDERAWPRRPERWQRYLGQPIANMLSSRGCTADCHFCSINAFHRESGGKRFRQRRPEAVVEEMAALYHDRGVRIFNFQDDNFLGPNQRQNIARLEAFQGALDRAGLGRIAIQAKARPDAIDDEVVSRLKQMGLFRLFLGVETDAVQGLRTLGRGVERAQNHRALAILRQQEIHTCFNLLMFDPDSTVASIRQNVEFMRRQAYFPLNFCRVEVYGGTAIEARLRGEGRLEGDPLGYTYKIADPRAQRAYEAFRQVFWPRNFGPRGTHHESMRVDYNYHLLRHLFPERDCRRLGDRVKALVHELNRDSAALMLRICDFAEGSEEAFDEGAFAALTEALRTDRLAADGRIGLRLRETLEHIEALATGAPRRQFLRTAAASAAAAALVVVAPGCGGGRTHMCEMVPDEPPPTSGRALSADELAQITARINQRIEQDLWTIFRDHQLGGLALPVDLSLSPGGAVQGCQVRFHGDPQVDRDLCGALGQMTFPFVVEGGVGQVTVTWEQALPDDDPTHMCEMAPMDPDGWKG